LNFRGKIFLSLAVAGCVPLALLGAQSFSVNRAELTRTVGAAQAATARAAATGCEKWIAQSIEQLRLSVGYLPYGELSGNDLATVLRIPLRQLAFVDVLAVLDEKGRALVPPLFALDGPPADQGTVEEQLAQLASHVPLAPAVAAGTAIGPAFQLGVTPRLPVAIRISGKPLRVVVAQISLAELAQQMRALQQEGGLAWIATREGRTVASASGASLQPGEEERAFIAESVTRRTAISRVLRRDGQEWLVSAAPAGDLGWVVIVAQPAVQAFHAADLVRSYTAFWALVALAFTGLVGFLLSRGLTEPIAQLSAAARAVTEGDYDRRVEISGGDELGEFAAAFNHMSGEVRRRDQEIRAWNVELQARVDARTAELKSAQDQILRARRLSALGSLGAGIVHELNNPVMGLMGIAALLKRELQGHPRHQEMLSALSDQALRISKIAGDLGRFSAQERTAAGCRFPLATSVKAALDLHAESCKGHNIQVAASLGEGIPEVQGDPVQMKEVVAHLVQNAIQAMPMGGKLRVTLDGLSGDAVKLTVSDTGSGVPDALRERIFDPFFTTKDRDGGTGLGLSIAYTIVKAHHGRLAVESPPGGGASFTVVLPAAAAAAHLS
jgi:two-component system, NtrC family, sensor kinase